MNRDFSFGTWVWNMELADSRVSIYAANAFNIHYNFLAEELSCNDIDVATLRVATKQTVTGDWTTSQTYWHKTYTVATNTFCQPAYPCTMGPSSQPIGGFR